MKPYLIFFAGAVLPFLVLIVHNLLVGLYDWKDRRRYQRAWDKFSAEWRDMSDPERATWKFANKTQPWDRQYASDRDYYFAKKWKHGQTTEV